MLEAIARVFVWLAAGKILMRVAGLPVPAPVIGLILLYADLLWYRRLPDALGTLADRLLGVLGVLFVPAGVGVIAYADIFRTELLPIAGAVVGGTLVTFLATALVTTLITAQSRRAAPSRARPSDPDAADVPT